MLLQAAREGLTNVRKHAAARSATLTLTYFADRCVLNVQDDGRGFVPDLPVAVDPTSGGLGLAGLRSRAAALGASVVVESAPGEGATLSVSIPYTEARPR
ncbi:MAG: ATP-binding protein [Chloroflexaceae bacterium]